MYPRLLCPAIADTYNMAFDLHILNNYFDPLNGVILSLAPWIIKTGHLILWNNNLVLNIFGKQYCTHPPQHPTKFLAVSLMEVYGEQSIMPPHGNFDAKKATIPVPSDLPMIITFFILYRSFH